MNKYTKRSLKMLLLSLGVVALVQTPAEAGRERKAVVFNTDTDAAVLQSIEANVNADMAKKRLENEAALDKEARQHRIALQQGVHAQERENITEAEGAKRDSIGFQEETWRGSIEALAKLNIQMINQSKKYTALLEKKAEADRQILELRKKVAAKRLQAREAAKAKAKVEIPEAELQAEEDRAAEEAQALVSAAVKERDQLLADVRLAEADLARVKDQALDRQRVLDSGD